MQFRRQPIVSSYQSTNPEHVATLNALNMAKEEILGNRRWEFDLRHDGQLMTKASTSSRNVSATFTNAAGSSSATLDLISLTASSEMFGDRVVRVVPTGSLAYGGTALRVNNAIATSTTAAVSLPVTLPDANTAVACNVIWAEYLLPDTVREVVRASHEETPLRLDMIDPTVTFDELVPALSWESGSPRILSIGGFDLATYDGSATMGVPKLRSIVWPVPDDEYVITYSYYYMHPDFTSGASVLDGVPANVTNDIVWLALSMMGMAWDNNFAAAHFADMAQSQASMKHITYGGSRARRNTVHSWDTSRTSSVFTPGFPNKLLGGG
jgi:hypothetical protein